MHEIEEIRSLPSEEILEKSWRNLEEKIWSEMSVFGRWEDRGIEREIERNELQIARGTIYRPPINIDRCRCRAICQGRCQENGCRQLQVSRKKPPESRTEARSINLAVKELSRGQKLCRLIHQVSRSCQDYDKKKT